MTDERTDEPSHLGLTRRSAGRIMVVIAYVGVVSALVGAVVGWQFLGELSDANKQGLVLAEETLSAVDTSLDVANDVVDAVDDALAALSSTILAVGDGIDATTAVAGSTAQLAATLPDTIDRIDNGLGSLESIAGTIDTTLGALSRIPLAPDYNPDVPLGDAVTDLRAAIGPLADDIRAATDRPRHVLGELRRPQRATGRSGRQCRRRPHRRGRQYRGDRPRRRRRPTTPTHSPSRR